MLDDQANRNNSPSLDTLTALKLLESKEGKEHAYTTLPEAWLVTQQLLGTDPKIALGRPASNPV